MTTAAALIRDARTQSGLTQAELARRLGVSQAALAKLERPGANPTLKTLQKVVTAAGHQLELRLGERKSALDESLLVEALRLTPAERIAEAERLQADAEAIAAAGARARGRA